MTDKKDSLKSVAQQFFTAFSKGDIAGAAEFMTDDGAWVVMGRLEGMSGRYPRDEFVKLAEGAKAIYSSGALVIEPEVMTAEDNRLSVTAKGRAALKDGRVYEPTYHFLMTFHDGKILEVHEYMDTAHAKDIFFGG